MTVQSKNGTRRVLLVEDQGKVVVQINKDGPEIEVDVIEIQNAWIPIDRKFRDDKGEVAMDRVPAWSEAARDFIRKLFLSAAGSDPARQEEMAAECEKLSLAGAFTFMKVITEEASRLQSFFEVKSPKTPSSRGNTELTFST